MLTKTYLVLTRINGVETWKGYRTRNLAGLKHITKRMEVIHWIEVK